jgi:hypothetical protein
VNGISLRQIGQFEIPLAMIQNDYLRAVRIQCSAGLIVGLVRLLERDVIQYIAIGEVFAEADNPEDPPFYDHEINGDGTVEWRRRRP